MNYLPFPFPNTIEIKITTGTRKKTIVAELASSEIEIFQSLTNRKKIDKPLVLYFKNPLIQSFSNQLIKFKVEQICVDYKTNIVKKYNIIYPSISKGEFIQSYSEFSLVILSPNGYFSKGLIVENKTEIII
jgi:uncharacterized membrane protein (UPF0127 family)